MSMPIKQTCTYVDSTDLVPEEWAHWFWAAISGDASFTWGDNNRSMVTASRFLEHCERVLDGLYSEDKVDPAEIEEFYAVLRELGETYIDLES